MPSLAKVLIFIGLLLLIAGLLLWFMPKFPGFKGLPGDMVFKKRKFHLLFSLGYQYTAQFIVDPIAVFVEEIWGLRFMGAL